MRNFLSIIFAIIAGFFICTLDIFAFIQLKNLPLELTIAGIYVILAGISLLISLVIMRFQNWKKRIGIVILGATAMTLFSILTFICMMMTDALKNLLNPESLTFFSNYMAGISWNFVLALLGGWLWFISDTKNK